MYNFNLLTDMKQNLLKKMLVGTMILCAPFTLTSCDDIISSIFDNPVTQETTDGSGGSSQTSNDNGGSSATSETYIKYTAPGTKTNEPIGNATKWTYTTTANVPAGTYYVEGTVNCNGALTLQGEVNLILKDGATLTVKDGISPYFDGSDYVGSLNIFAQSEGTSMGHLIVKNDTPVGVSPNTEATALAVMALTIHGGLIDVTADTGTTPADYGGDGIEIPSGTGNMIFYAGTVNATGKKGRQGIVNWASGKIEFDGANVTAIGGDDTTTGAAGIQGTTLVVNKGTVTAKGGNGATIGFGTSFTTVTLGDGITMKEGATEPPTTAVTTPYAASQRYVLFQ